MSDANKSKGSKKSAGKGKNPGKRKAPGFMSFVVWRQFFMVLGAPGVATAFMHAYPEIEVNFYVVLISAAVPSLVHGQLWKWTYDWAGRGPAVMRNLRIGQIALGAVHTAACAWALSLVAMGTILWSDGSFFYGLAIAGGLAGAWETVRPVLELRDPPEVKEEEERKRRRAAARKKKKARAKKKKQAASEDEAASEGKAASGGDTSSDTDDASDADTDPGAESEAEAEAETDADIAAAAAEADEDAKRES